MLVIKQAAVWSLLVGEATVDVHVIDDAPARRAKVWVDGRLVAEVSVGSVVLVDVLLGGRLRRARLLVDSITSQGQVRWVIDAPREIPIRRTNYRGAA